jgi:hypothetical protein
VISALNRPVSLRPLNLKVRNPRIPPALSQKTLNLKKGPLIQNQAGAAPAALTRRDSAGFQLVLASPLADIPHGVRSRNAGYCHAALILARGAGRQR